MTDLERELEGLASRLTEEAAKTPGVVILACVAELVDIACGNNLALRDFKRLQIYRRIAVRLGIAKRTPS